MPRHLKLYSLNEFRMHHGGMLSKSILAYETWGELNADKSNAILIFTGLSADSHAASHNSKDTSGWWEYMLGAGKAIDTNKWFVVCVSSLGSCKGSTGPCSPNPQDNEPYRFQFPDLTLEDIANSTLEIIDSLKIKKLKCLIGPSMGGMTSLALLLQHPGIAENMVNIASGCYSEPFSTAIRSLQREAVLKDENFQNGHYSKDEWPVEGMKIARKLGMLSYRSAIEWRERFPRGLKQRPTTPFGIEFPVESYLEHHASKFVYTFDPVSYIYLSRAMDWFNAFDYCKKQSQNPFLGTNLKTSLVIGAQSDILFPPHQQQQLAELLQQSGCKIELKITPSIQGHDAFLVDEDNYSKLLKDYLDSL